MRSVYMLTKKFISHYFARIADFETYSSREFKFKTNLNYFVCFPRNIQISFLLILRKYLVCVSFWSSLKCMNYRTSYGCLQVSLKFWVRNVHVSIIKFWEFYEFALFRSCVWEFIEDFVSHHLFLVIKILMSSKYRVPINIILILWEPFVA